MASLTYRALAMPGQLCRSLDMQAIVHACVHAVHLLAGHAATAWQVPDYDDSIIQRAVQTLASKQLGEYEHRRRLESLAAGGCCTAAADGPGSAVQHTALEQGHSRQMEPYRCFYLSVHMRNQSVPPGHMKSPGHGLLIPRCFALLPAEPTPISASLSPTMLGHSRAPAAGRVGRSSGDRAGRGGTSGPELQPGGAG